MKKFIRGDGVTFTSDEMERLHSFNDEPSYVSDELKEWHKDGKLHRDNDLPAQVFSDGTKVWYRDGMLHREKGYAILYSNGNKKYALDDLIMSFELWLLTTPITEEEKLEFKLSLID